MSEKSTITEMLELTTEIVAAHVGNNPIPPSELPSLIQDVYRTLVSAAMKSGQLNMARALMSERTADRPTSIWNWRTYARVLATLDDEAGAVSAWRKARDLLAGLTL